MWQTEETVLLVQQDVTQVELYSCILYTLRDKLNIYVIFEYMYTWSWSDHTLTVNGGDNVGRLNNHNSTVKQNFKS